MEDDNVNNILPSAHNVEYKYLLHFYCIDFIE